MGHFQAIPSLFKPFAFGDQNGVSGSDVADCCRQRSENGVGLIVTEVQ